MAVLVPAAALNPALALVVLLSHKYKYGPFPPKGVEPVKEVGVEPEHIICELPIEFEIITGVTVISITLEVTGSQSPEFTTLLNQVVVTKFTGV
jgi:hypothetical protein